MDLGLHRVKRFHEVFNCHIGTEPSIPDEPVHLALAIYHQEAARLAEDLKRASAEAGGSLLLIRLQLIQEELAELAAGFISRDPVEVLDALVDLTYVVDGTYLTCGLQDLKEPAQAEVHRSNMSKLDNEGNPIISDAGRVVKGPNYTPPDLRRVVYPAAIDKFPGIRAVALEIAYDNDFINRHTSERDWLLSLDPVLGADGVDETDLRLLDQWCQTLTPSQVTDLAAGEEADMAAVAQLCPKPELCGLFQDIFQPPEAS